MNYTAYLGLGSNLASSAGDPADTIRAAVRTLASLGSVAAQSSLYRTAPVGYREQPYFINAVVCLLTELEPEPLLRKLLEIERSFGRDRRESVPKGPRTLDLDILLILNNSGREGEALRHESPFLKLPHPEIANRRFVLEPLAEIAPEMRHPVLGKSMRQLRDELSSAGGNGDEEVKRL
jgi:2-amino-4-hydroxy-6-hydroxymethyldihydropteridine diphosphokinase